MTSSRPRRVGPHVLESAIRHYARDLLTGGVLANDMPMHEAVQTIKDLVDYGFLVPCVVSDTEPWILFVPRSTSAEHGGPFDPLTLLGGDGV